MDVEIMKLVMQALKDASDHLDYCGYGDSWERECARASGLEKRIETALEAGYTVLPECRPAAEEDKQVSARGDL